MIQLLLIDDNYEHAAALWKALRKNKIINPLSVVTNSTAALNLLKGGNGVLKMNPFPGIILLDINVARMNGEELLRNLKSDKLLKSIPVFLMINSPDDKYLVKEFHERITGYILKPVSIGDFALTVSINKYFWQLKEQPQ